MIPKRVLGKTNEELSIVGFGGILVTNEEQSRANSIVAQAIEKGINYFDVAPSYGDAELRLGPALRGKRNKVFLACKTGERTKEGAEKQLIQSMKNLETDHFDLYQLHAMTTEEDFNTVIGPNGALETFLKAKEKGLIRYIGFSAHSSEIALKLMDAFNFDTILFPINWVNMMNANFGPAVIEKARSKNMGIFAIKAMAMTVKEKSDNLYPKCWYKPVSDPELAALAYRFTLSQPVTAAVPPGEYELFSIAIKVAENFKEITQEEIEYLKQKAYGLEPIFKLA